MSASGGRPKTDASAFQVAILSGVSRAAARKAASVVSAPITACTAMNSIPSQTSGRVGRATKTNAIAPTSA